MFSCIDIVPNDLQNGGVVFGLSDRLGGVSNAPFNSLNLSFNVGDNENAVAKNLNLLLQGFAKVGQSFSEILDSKNVQNFDKLQKFKNVLDSENIWGFKNLARSMQAIRTDNLNFLTQMHSTQSRIVSRPDGVQNVGEADALITNQKGINLLILVADCNPVLFFDKKNSILALMHAGREGVFKQICTQTFTQMQECFGSSVSDIFAFVGAGIRKCCYEVGSEIITQLSIQQRESYTHKIAKNSYKLDLALMLADELRLLGITDSHILQTCTHCEKSFFSYRREGKTGRFGLLAQMF